jgi:hypothetical protein
MKQDQLNHQNKKKKDNWFLRVSMQVSAFGLAFAAYSKVKGPVGNVLNAIAQRQIEIVQQRAEFKSSNEKIFGEKKINPYYTYSIDSTPKRQDSSLGRNLYGTKSLMRKTIWYSESIEHQFYNEVGRNINSFYSQPIFTKNRLHGYKFIEKINRKDLDEDEFFFDTRKKTLLIYLAKNNEIGGGNLSEIESLNDAKKDKFKIKSLHLMYLREDANYSEEYNSELNNFKKTYRFERNKITQSKLGNGSIMDLAPITTFTKAKFIGSQKRVSMLTVEEAGQMRVDATHKIKVTSQDQLWKQISNGRKYTSSSEVGKMDYLRGDIFKIAGKFDYTEDIKELIETVQSFNKENYNIGNLHIEFVEEGSPTSPRYYLKIIGNQVNKKKNYEVKIPVAQNGMLPATNSFGRQRHDVITPNSYGSVGKNLEDFSNSTQLGIRGVTRAINSNLMHSVETGLQEAFSSMNRSLARTLEPAARLENTPRDAITGVLINTEDRRLSNKLVLSRAFNSLDVFRRLSRYKDSGAINITIDLETLSAKRYGPDVNAVDAYTQITQAGFTVGEIDRTGKYSIKEMTNHYSSHGIDIIEKQGGFNKENALWLKQFLPDKVKNALKVDANPEEICQAWAKFHESLSDDSFKSNQDIARRIIKEITDVVENNSGKPVYLTTKFGTAFDLKILNIWDPIGFADLMKKAPHLDLQGVAHLQQMANGSRQSLSQSNLLKSMMATAGYDPHYTYDFSKKTDVVRAITKLRSGGHLVMSNAMFNKISSMEDSIAHNAGIDTLLLHSLVGFNLNNYLSGKEKFDTSFDFLENRFAKMHKFKTIDEQWEEANDLERTSYFGHIASAMGLSQGLAAQRFLSLVGSRHFLVSPDVPANKQWNQMVGGGFFVPGKTAGMVLGQKGGPKSVAAAENLTGKQIRKIIFPSVQSAGELDAVSWSRGADAEKNLFSHTVNVKYFATVGAFGNMESVHRLSHNVLEKANMPHLENVNLSEVAGIGGDPNLSNRIREIYKQIRKRARDYADTDGSVAIKEAHYQQAAVEIINAKNGISIIPKSTKLLASSGGKGSTIIRAPVDGIIQNIHVDLKDDDLKVYADIEFLLNSHAELPWTFRGLTGKAQATFDRLVTEGLMFGGVEGYGPAQFMEKEYVGSMKTIVYRNGFENLFDKLENGTATEKENARKMIKKWSGKLNLEHNETLNLMVHDSYKEGSFGKIKRLSPDGSLNARWADAQKYIGNINMNAEEFRTFMIDTGHVWTVEKAKQWYGIWNTQGGGRNNLIKFYEKQVDNVRKMFDKPTGDLAHILSDMDQHTKTKYLNSQIALMKNYILPAGNNGHDFSLVAKGIVPMFFEAREKLQGSNVFDIGILVNDAMVGYGAMTGNHGRATQIKLRRSILGQIADFNYLTPTTKKLLEDARISNVHGKARLVAETRRNFTDSVYSGFVVKKRIGIKDIKGLLDLRKGLDIEKLRRYAINPEKIEELLKYFESILEGYGNPEDIKEEAAYMIEQLRNDDLIKGLTKDQNKSFATLQYAHDIAKFGSDAGYLWKLENDQALIKNGLLDFNIEEILRTFPTNLKLNQNIPNKDVILNILSHIGKAKGDLVDKVFIDNKTVRLKNIIMRAPAHIDSVINLLSKPGETSAVGMVTEEMKSVNEVLRAYESFHNAVKNDKEESIAASRNIFQKQYLNYLMRNFISVDEDEIELQGFTGKSQDSNSIYARLQDLKSQGKGKFNFAKLGFKGTEKFTAEMANEYCEGLLKNFHISDIYLHEGFYKNNVEFNSRENELFQAKNHFEMVKNVVTKDAALKLTGDEMIRKYSFYGDVIRYPIGPAGHVPMLTSRFNIIPKEIAGHLGVDINMMALSAQYWKLVRGDNDGDNAFGIIHAFDSIESLNKFRDEHKQSFNEILNMQVEGKDKNGKPKLVKLSEQLAASKLFGGIDMVKKKLMIDQFDEEGYAKRTLHDLHSVEAQEVLEASFKGFGNTLTQLNLHDPSLITSEYVKTKVDQNSLVEISKNTIGIFENILSTRKRQLLQFDVYSKNNVLQKELDGLVGNVFSGIAGMSQGPITLGKHGNAETLHKLSLSVQALLNTGKRVKEQDEALLHWMKGLPDKDGVPTTSPLFDSSIVEKHHRNLTQGITDYFDKLGARDQMVFLAETNQQAMELGKNFSLLTELSTRALDEVQNLSYQSMSKKSFSKLINFGKSASKFGSIGAAVYIAANFFNPNRLSSSINPFGAFTDLGTDLDGNHNAIFSDLELDRSVPLDSVEPSFSKKAFIRMNELTNNNKYKKEHSNIISRVLEDSYENSNPFIYEWRTPPNLTYTNYGSYIGSFGNTNITRKSNYVD